MNIDKKYTIEEILDKFQKMTKNDKISILSTSIDYALSYNGRSKETCIALAMGYENFEGRRDTYKIRK